jgi:molybdopterin-synthase adenylyltransferase
MLLPEFGPEAQARLAAGHAVVVGCGALGCSIADQLARAGVGRLTLIDRDVVEISNLQRQVLFDEADAAEGIPKAEAARRRLSRVNSAIGIDAHIADLNAGNAERLLFGSSCAAPTVLLDGTDNFETRYLLNDLAVKHRVAYLYGGVVGSRGMQATFIPRGLPGETACLRCLFDEIPAPGTAPTCDTAGVLGPVVSIIAACQAADALKVLIGRGDRLSGTLLEMDLWSNHRRRLELGGPRAECPCCGQGRFIFLDASHAPTAALCGQDAVQVHPAGEVRLDLGVIAERLANHGEFRSVGNLLLRGEFSHERGEGGRLELTVFGDGRAIVKGTTRPELARSIYARYIGT